MFTYCHICPDCGQPFEQTRKNAYSKPRRLKRCVTCKESKQTTSLLAIEGGGAGCDQRCETCVHFGVETGTPTNMYWQACGQGKHSNDGEGILVYFEDVCDEYEPFEDDEL